MFCRRGRTALTTPEARTCLLDPDWARPLRGVYTLSWPYELNGHRDARKQRGQDLGELGVLIDAEADGAGLQERGG